MMRQMIVSMLQRGLQIGVLISIMFVSSRFACAQQPVSEALDARAKATEMRIVEQYGTPAQIAGFQNPHHVPPGVKKPKFPKNPQVPQDMAEWMDYASYDMEPDVIYANVYSVALAERYMKGILQGPTAEHKAKVREIAAGQFVAGMANQALAMTPIGAGAILQPIISAAIQQAANKLIADEQANEQERRAAAEGLALSQGLEDLLKKNLSAEEFAKYKSEDAQAKAGDLLRMAEESLKRQGTPSGYALMTVAQIDGNRYATGPMLDSMHAMSGDARFGAAAWAKMSKAEKWAAMDENLVALVQEGQASMSQSASAKIFIAKLHFPEEITGRALVLGAFGPEVLPMYKKASAEEKRRMETERRIFAPPQRCSYG